MALTKINRTDERKPAALRLINFELFPPRSSKTDKGMENLPGTIEHLCEFIFANRNTFLLHTEQAGWETSAPTLTEEVCQMVKKAGAVPVTHFTVIKNTKEGIKDQLETYLSEGVDHILALRGDFPRGEKFPQQAEISTMQQTLLKGIYP